ncbi:hypothetical protein SAMN05216597_0371 [Pseudomonas cannabina]|nr:hypothetical protein SAMN05216597_0371 [Pseudomonas cannabina]
MARSKPRRHDGLACISGHLRAYAIVHGVDDVELITHEELLNRIPT